MIGNPPWGQTKPPVGYGVDWGDPINEGLVGRWLINEGSGAIACDLVRNRNGSIVGNNWAAGKFGTTLKGTGALGSGYVSWSSFTMPATGTIILRQKCLATNWNSYGTMLSKRDDFIMHSNASATTISLYGAAVSLIVTVTPTVPIDDLVSYAWVLTGAKSLFFNNGIQINETTTSTKWGTSTAAMNFGADTFDPTNRNLNGYSDQLFISQRCLELREIKRFIIEPFAGIQTPSRRFISLAAVGGAAPWANRINNLIGTGVNVS